MAPRRRARPAVGLALTARRAADVGTVTFDEVRTLAASLASLHDAHVGARARHRHAALLVQSWQQAGPGPSREVLARDLMRRCAFILRVGQSMPEPFVEWLAGTIQAGAEGDPSVAFGTKRGRGGSRDHWFDNLRTAGLVHSVMIWRGTTKTRAGRVVGAVLKRNPGQIVRTYNTAVAEWQISGPFKILPGPPMRATTDRADYRADVLGRGRWGIVAVHPVTDMRVVSPLDQYRDRLIAHLYAK